MMRKLLSRRFLLGLAAYSTTALALHGVTYNYDFNADAAGNYAGLGVAPDAGTFWNSVVISNGSANTILSTIRDSNNVLVSGSSIFILPVGSTMKVASVPTGGEPTPLALMQDYINGGNYTVYLSGLKPATYLMYAYGHGSAAEDTLSVSIAAANGSGVGATTATATDYRNTQATGALGTAYTVIDNIVVPSNGLLTFSFSNYLNGFQLIEKVSPQITTPAPATLEAYIGLRATLTNTVTGPTGMTYEWQKSPDGVAAFVKLDEVANPSAATASLVLNNLTVDNAGVYRLVIHSPFGDTTSGTTTLTVVANPAPLFNDHPDSLSLGNGQEATFTANAFAEAGVAYQWFHNGELIDGATDATYTIASPKVADVGTYTVVASNEFGSNTSDPATLTLKLPAFPGADGPGDDATGGRGGDVYHVTNLDDDIANPPVGSLRAALKNIPAGGRTIVFDVSGLVYLDAAPTTTGWLKADGSNLTVAGETAPWPGITIGGQGTKFSGANNIIRHLKIRPGKHQLTPGISTHDGLSNYTQRSIIDHISVSWCDDELISSTDLADTTTVQYALAGEGLYYNLEGGKTHSYGALINSEVDYAPISYHHNIWAHIQSRLPRIQAEVQPGMYLNWSNNVVYNWLGNAGYTGDEITWSNFVGNYYIQGANTRPSDSAYYAPTANSQMYVADNFYDIDHDSALDGFDPGRDAFFRGTPTYMSEPFPAVGLNDIDPTATLVTELAKRAGAFWWDRDVVDSRIIEDLLTLSGEFFPEPTAEDWDIPSQSRPADFDRDGDGMSDAWERAHGLNPLIANPHGDINGDGYTNLQNYLIDLGAFELMRAPRWQGGTARFVEPTSWYRWWQPSRFDTVRIGEGTALVDTVGNWAGHLEFDPTTGQTASVEVSDGWLYVAGDVANLGTGQAHFTQSAGTVRIDGTLILGTTLGYHLGGGTLYAKGLELTEGGNLDLAGGTLHTASITAASLSLAGGTFSPGNDDATNTLAAALSDRALVPVTTSHTGVTTASGSLDLAGATTVIDLESLDLYDRLAVAGTLALGGELRVNLRNGFTPPLGAAFPIAQAGNITGSFANVPDGFALQTSGGTLTLTYVGNILTYTDWADSLPFATASDRLASADPDGDGWSNLEEFAFDGNPLTADEPAGLPHISRTGPSVFLVPGSDPRFTFSHRLSTDLSYTVQTSTDLQTWADFWTTSDGYGVPAVESIEPGSFFNQVNLRLTQDTSEPVFVRVLVYLSEDTKLIEPLGVTGDTGVPVDLPPSLVFNRTVQAGTTGSIRLHAADGTVLSTIDLAANPRRSLATEKLSYSPVTTRDNLAFINLERGSLAYGQTYYLTYDAGVIRDADGNALPGVSDDQTLRFSTRASGPTADDRTLTVDWDGSADFCTVQGAIEAIANGLTERTTITVANGDYEELVYLGTQLGPITIRGESRDGTVIRYTNNANRNSSRASFRNRANDLTLENVTLWNTTPAGGSQAEAFQSQASRVVVRNSAFRSYQDTLRLDKSAYFEDCYIEGDVDYIWGDGVGYFDNCWFHNLRDGYLVQSRNPETGHGFVFNECLITGEPEADIYLARIAPADYPQSEVVFLNCAMDGSVRAEGWQLNGATTAPAIRFYEFNSTGIDGQPLDFSTRHVSSKRLNATEAAPYFDKVTILGFDPSTR